MNPKAVDARLRAAFTLTAALALGAVALALVSQHVFDMQPCPWCVLQRALYVALALLALPAAVWPRRAVVTACGSGVGVLCAAGAASALWQHLVAAATSSCNLTLADRIVSGLGLDAMAPEVFAPRASCADAAVDLLGLPYAYWSLLLFLALGAGVAWAVRTAWRGGR